ncbi:MAG: undecaprenyldiphospho-muramoylpentapeptide beta-N-acetylglucosaminyltransferase [Alphaproteobacteria bacterium]|nr:undecaprenyldiphospho-muramoylpentapeptide beta-N-acetylglucosaminyltransferase [Alphaproteobacteria bacterium]NCQ87465.1 undecaprenyldiphospho-muramoylpentapeptide beta-N-acetylglucosaminyltransferase [Alphaproteobacteria bacterium]NCT06336.1 undecaprenyldiphospho-muramoylpentapeptide beta-N-acetylglucosaminyltransferase [Alphaproteobacteria bacterium]
MNDEKNKKETVNKDSKQILISAGGTGGHMFPAEALARDLIGRGYRVALATDIRGRKYEPFADGIPVYVLKSGSLKSGILSKFGTLISLALGTLQAKSLVRKLKPAVVIGFGGYPSFPAVYAAQKARVATIIHEQNAVLGKANAVLAKRADRIALSWPKVGGIDESDAVRAVIVGNPVRPDIAALYNQPYPAIEQDGALRIFVIGGSQGASVFSDVLPKALDQLSKEHKARLEIVQQCRAEDIDRVREAYGQSGIRATLAPFFKDVSTHLGHAHLVIARSGAGTVAEVTTAGRPAIFVPYPHHADQQQKHNADTVADVGGAWVMTQDGFTVEALLTRIETFLQNPETLFRAAENARTCGKPDAARRLGNLVTALASGWDKEASKAYDLTQGRND